MNIYKQTAAARFLDGGLTVFVISPQPWDGIKISKHHYAEEMARFGHKVYFINPPVARADAAILRKSVGKNLEVVKWTLGIPLFCKFRARPFYDLMMRRRARRLCDVAAQVPDLIWDFDNTCIFSDLRWFGPGLSIYHPVDPVPLRWNSAKHADLVFSVSQKILDRTECGGAPAQVVPHGLGREFAEYARRQMITPGRRKCERITIGYVGNLGAAGVDLGTLDRLVKENADVFFEFFGPFSANDGGNAASVAWANGLQGEPNCVLRGRVSKATIIERAPLIDAWLLCYDAASALNGGLDSHKILEYFATGAPVISSYIDAYRASDLLWMAETPENSGFLKLFRSAMDRLRAGSEDRESIQRRRRLELALAREYSVNCRTIADSARTCCGISHSSGSLDA